MNTKSLIIAAAFCGFLSHVTVAQDIYAADFTKPRPARDEARTVSYVKKNTLVAFEPNLLSDTKLRFRGRLDKMSIQFLSDRIRVNSEKEIGFFHKKKKHVSWSLSFLDASENATMNGNKRLPAKDGSQNAFGEIWYKEIYQGVDLRFFSAIKEGVRYDIVVKSGADLEPVALKMQGLTRMRIAKNNVLEYTTPDGNEYSGAIKAYQVIDGEEVPVNAVPKIRNGVLRFEANDYDKQFPLIIETPVLLAIAKN